MINDQIEMDTTEIITFGSKNYEFAWTEGGELPVGDVKQVSGYVFNDRKEILIVKNKNWTVPGGHPEESETPVETLKREVMEEAMVEITNISYLGHVKVTDLETKEVTYQLRYTADASEIHDFDKKFETSERIFVKPSDLVTYIPWAAGKVFSLEVAAASKSLKARITPILGIY